MLSAEPATFHNNRMAMHPNSLLGLIHPKSIQEMHTTPFTLVQQNQPHIPCRIHPSESWLRAFGVKTMLRI